MNLSPKTATLAAGACAGLVNGLFGAGGGMVLVPLLGLSRGQETDVFSSSVAIILPICLVSLTWAAMTGDISWQAALPYLPGSALGGYLAGRWSSRIPAKWLHRTLGIFILWGGARYLC